MIIMYEILIKFLRKNPSVLNRVKINSIRKTKHREYYEW